MNRTRATLLFPEIRESGKEFLRRYGVIILLALMFAAEGWCVRAVTTKRVTREVTARVTKTVTDEVTADLRAGFQRYLEQLAASEEISDEDYMTELLAQHIAGLRMDRGVTEAGAWTYAWGVDIARLASGKYGGSLKDVLAGNIENYVEGHPVRNEDRTIARKIITAYLAGERPDRWRPDLEFAEINADGSVTARNELHTSSRTRYWEYEG